MLAQDVLLNLIWRHDEAIPGVSLRAIAAASSVSG